MDNENLDTLFEEALDVQESATADEDGQQAEQDTPDEKAPEKAEQTPEERSRQAEGRRLREREQRAYNQARADMSAVIKRLGIINPETDKPIESVEEMEAYEKALSDERISKGRGNAEDMKRLVKEAIREETRPAAPKVTKAEIDAQLAEIKAMDPEMTNLGTILQSENGEKFREYVSRGLNFVDAYTLAARDRLAELAAGRGSKAAQAKAAGKAHLTGTRTRGGGDVAVPQETAAMYRMLMPEMTDEEIQKAYNADVKKYGG
jgi:hypothetical protein